MSTQNTLWLTMRNDVPEWISVLDSRKPNHVSAWRSYNHQSCRVLEKACEKCVMKNRQCFLAGDIAQRCVSCMVLGGKCLQPVDSNENDDAPATAATQGHGSPHSNVTLISASEFQEQHSRVRSESNHKPADTLSSNMPKRRRLGDGTAQTAKEQGQPLHAVETLSVQRRQLGDYAAEQANERGQSLNAIKALSVRRERFGDHAVERANERGQCLNAIELEASSVQPRSLEAHASDHANQRERHINAPEPPPAQPPQIPMPSTVSANPRGQSDTMRGDMLPSTSSITIDDRKQRNTTLYISIPSSSDVVPLKLRSCMTMASLFDSVLERCGLAEQSTQVFGLRTTLNLEQNAGNQKSLMLMRNIEHSFETFLKMIDASRCWEREDGSCAVGIEVVMA